MRYRFLRFPEGKTKAVTFSYDDGSRHDLRLVEILNHYGIKCTFNINHSRMGKSSADWTLTKEEIEKQLIGNGHEIAVHGDFHRAPGKLRPIDGIQDVLNGRLGLEKEFQQIIRGMAYPDSGITEFQNGASYDNIKRYLTDLDIVYSRTLGGDNNSFALPTDWHSWMPTAHHDNPLILDWAKEFLDLDVHNQYIARRTPRLFYVWGHSFEFDRKNNWEHLEDLCQALAGKEDIWYATNGEIYDYVEAYNSLVYSADGMRIYNPTLMTIWFDIDGTLYSIKSGETIVLG